MNAKSKPVGKKQPEITNAGEVLRRLSLSKFKAPGHAMLSEVRNATGYASFARTADALVVSLWPSRGIWFAAVEVKVSRSDWLRELVQPEKAEAISKYCEYQWVATPPGIVKLHELPVAWGLIEVTRNKCDVVKEAPRRKAEPLRTDFVAAVLRNRADYESGLRQRVLDELKLQNAEPVSADAEVLRDQLRRMEYALEDVRRELTRRNEITDEFERKSGVRIDGWNHGKMGAAVGVALELGDKQLVIYAQQLEHSAKQLRAAHTELSQVRLPLSSPPPPLPLLAAVNDTEPEQETA
jgi:hypothetical protein